jgi:glycosyltransferase involved in cell wall biosynthesis
MKILLLAPQPFYQERGTPIATRMLARALCGAGHSVDMLTYHLGEDVQIEGLNIYRTWSLPFVKNMPIGFSFGKRLCDVRLFFKTIRMLWKGSYDVVHAGEESIFFTLLIPRGNLKIVYDMDSSMPDQLLEKWSFLRILTPVMYGFERLAIRRSDVVLPVCDALADRVQESAPGMSLRVLEDVAMDLQPSGESVDAIRQLLPDGSIVAMYIGNLEHYQGMDLLINSLLELNDCEELSVVFIGGSNDDIEHYRRMAATLGVSAQCSFLGPRPVADLMLYLKQADILISPRIKGVNTPMKVYSYMGAGKAIIATDIASHTQVLDEDSAMLVSAEPVSFATGLAKLCKDEGLRARLGRASQDLAESRHTYSVFENKLLGVYRQLDTVTHEA